MPEKGILMSTFLKKINLYFNYNSTNIRIEFYSNDEQVDVMVQRNKKLFLLKG